MSGVFGDRHLTGPLEATTIDEGGEVILLRIDQQVIDKRVVGISDHVDLQAPALLP